jgi:DNA-binding NarL/FixJ family response regulator
MSRPEQPPVARAVVAVVAEDQFAAHRISGALNASGLSPSEVASSAESLLQQRPGGTFDAIVLACESVLGSGLAEIRMLAAGFPGARIVVVSSAQVGSGVRQALTAGADGVVYDSELECALGPATHSVLVGQVSLPRRLRRCAVRPAFSTREKQILTLVVHGCANREIANRLFLAESTIKTHLASAFDKLGVRSRKEAAALLVDPDEGLGVTLAGVTFD